MIEGKIRRGDVFYCKVREKAFGSLQYGMRPCVVVSNNACNKHSRVIEIVFITGAEKKEIPTHVHIQLEKPSIVLCEQIASIDVSQLRYRMRSLTKEEMKKVDDALRVSLGL